MYSGHPAMGLKISPSAFSRLMTIAMAGLNYENCFVYLDDLIVFGRTADQHNKNLIAVFERLRKVNLKLNPLKCNFMKKSVLYLGHKISAEGILPDPEKVIKVKNYPIPKNADETKRFVAFANYYRKFIKNFAGISACLTRLSKKDVKFVWTSECQKSFETLRNCLINPEILDYPDLSEKNVFKLTTDASKIGLGAVLANSNGRVVAYLSRNLNKQEKNYSTTEIELLAIVWATKQLRPYLFGRYFEIYTDHRPLIYLFSQADPSSRLNKFRMSLLEYNFDIIYVKGKDNVVADALSRISIKELQEITEKVENSHVLVTTRSKTRKLNQENEPQSTELSERNDQPALQPTMCEITRKLPHLVDLQVFKVLEKENDLKGIELKENLKKIFRESKKTAVYYEKNNTIYIRWPNSGSIHELGSVLQDLLNLCENLSIKEIIIKTEKENRGLVKLLEKNREILKERELIIFVLKGATSITNEKEKEIILNDFHLLPTSGHAGISRMTKTVKKYYFWKGMDADIKNFVEKCDSCQRHKQSNQTKEPLMITTTSTTALSKIFLDLIGPFNSDLDNYTYALTMQCELTKYLIIAPLRNKEAESVARAFVEKFILVYGIPECITTDCGTEFLSQIFKETAKLLRIEQLQSTAYHHQTVGSLENTHKHASAFIRAQIAKYGDIWSSWLSFWAFAFNTTVHSSTRYTPFELVFGRICQKPSNIEIGQNTPIYNTDNYRSELLYRLKRAWEDAHVNLLQTKLDRKLKYDKQAKGKEFLEGDLVLLKKENRKKLDDVFIGPFRIIKIEKESPNVKLKIGYREQVVHKDS